MWIQELPENYQNISYSRQSTIFLWKDDSLPIYIMDNHLAATWCWLQECDPKEKYNFIHIDKHTDLKACGYTAQIDFLKKGKHISYEDYRKITYANGRNYPSFQWDNYIRTCHYLYPNWFNVNLFYVHKRTLCGEEWGYPLFTPRYRDTQNIINDIKQIIQGNDSSLIYSLPISKDLRENKWIVNLDLDFFCGGYSRTSSCSTRFIQDFANCIGGLLPITQVLTIALSPNCFDGNGLKEKWKNAVEILAQLSQSIECLNKIRL